MTVGYLTAVSNKCRDDENVHVPRKFSLKEWEIRLFKDASFQKLSETSRKVKRALRTSRTRARAFHTTYSVTS